MRSGEKNAPNRRAFLRQHIARNEKRIVFADVVLIGHVAGHILIETIGRQKGIARFIWRHAAMPPHRHLQAVETGVACDGGVGRDAERHRVFGQSNGRFAFEPRMIGCEDHAANRLALCRMHGSGQRGHCGRRSQIILARDVFHDDRVFALFRFERPEAFMRLDHARPALRNRQRIESVFVRDGAQAHERSSGRRIARRSRRGTERGWRRDHDHARNRLARGSRHISRDFERQHIQSKIVFAFEIDPQVFVGAEARIEAIAELDRLDPAGEAQRQRNSIIPIFIGEERRHA
ncbi:MAG: hypothetical protein BWZ10_01557 [candidate division BRC1 bacterium ADurb.BinA364]|nr:MAG: hypothetical protein BWZ10_01557 [candidate division BRC1 bacterium ADurb.BinA364]